MAPPAPPTILVVDDSATVRMQVGTVLTQAGFNVQKACDGVQGVSRINEGGIDGVICDVNMPNMNGLDMVRTVKADVRHKTLPILMLTTEGSQELVAQAQHAGAAGWVVKPFKAELLVAAVKKLTAQALTI